MSTLEKRVDELDELVDGQEEWSHRKQLHALRDRQASAKLVSEALDAFREARDQRMTRLREWGSFVIAATAIALHWWH